MQAELDNLMLQVKNSEEKARKAAVDAGEAKEALTTKRLFIVSISHLNSKLRCGSHYEVHFSNLTGYFFSR